MKSIPFYLFALCFLISGCKSPKVVVEDPTTREPIVSKRGEHRFIQEPIGNNTYTLQPLDTLELVFKTNASTGFYWRWINQPSCTQIDSLSVRYELIAPELVGSGAMMYWQFLAQEKGTDTLHFGYAPVYDTAAIVQAYKVIVNIR